VKAGARYAAVVFGASFVLDRVGYAIGRFAGPVPAELVETPFRVLAYVIAAKAIVPRMAATSSQRHRLIMGLIGAALLIVAECALWMFSTQIGVVYLASRHPVALGIRGLMMAVAAGVPLFVNPQARTHTDELPRRARLPSNVAPDVSAPTPPQRGTAPATPREGRLPSDVAPAVPAPIPPQRAAARATLIRWCAQVVFLASAVVFASLYAWMWDPWTMTLAASLVTGGAAVAIFVLLMALAREARAARAVYLAGAAMSVAAAILYPAWRGVLYDTFSSGTDIHRIRELLLPLEWLKAPLWDAPALTGVGGEVANPPVRWPLTVPAAAGSYMEPVLIYSAAQATLGLIAMGLVAGWRLRRFPLNVPIMTLHVAFSTAVTLVIAWMCLWVVTAASMGLILSEEAILGSILAAGVITGAIHGIWDYRRRVQRSGVTVPDAVDQLQAPTSLQATAPIAAVSSATPGGIGNDLFRFALGLVLACVLAAAAMIIEAWISAQVPGAVQASMTQSESIRHAMIATGARLLFTVSGLGLAWWLWKCQRRALAAGVATGTMALGLMLLTAVPFPAGW
jgi:hypothetical protein